MSDKLPLREKVGYGIGEIAGNIIWQTVMFFLPIFYTDTFGIPAAVVGTMFFVVRFFDGVNDPIMGMIADRTNSRWGKYRPYVLFIAIPYGVGGILMFTTPDLSLEWKIIYAYGTYIFMMIIYTAIMIPFAALSGVMTSSYLGRTSLNSYRFVGAFVGGLFIQGLALFMVSYLGADNESVVTASIEKNQLIIAEQGTGSAKITLTAKDPNGAIVEEDFTINVKQAGENPPEIKNAIGELTFKEGYGKYEIAVDTVFEDPDKDELIYSASSSDEDVLEADIEGGKLRLKEKSFGTAIVTLTADDDKGGVATDNIIVRVAKSGNKVPVIRDSLPNKTYEEVIEQKGFDLASTFGVFEEDEIDISNLFADPDGDELFVTVTTSNSKVVAATVVDDKLILKKKAAGSVILSLNADDGKGGFASQELEVTIDAKGNNPPVLKKPIGSMTVQAGFGSKSIDLKEIFADKDGEAITYEFTTVVSSKGYSYTMTIFAVLCVILFFITFATTRERIKPISKQNSKVWDDLKDLSKNGPWIILFIVSLVTLIYVAVRSAVIAYYLEYYVGDSSLTGAFLVVGSVTIIISLTMTKWLTKIFDKRLLYVICMIGVGVSVSFYHILGPESIILMFVLQIAQSFFSGPTMPLLWSMLADAADYSEWKNGRKAMGLAYSASTLAQKVGFGVGGAIALWLLAFYGYQPNMEQSETSLLGMRLMMGIYPAVGAFLCAILIWFYKLDSKTMLTVEKELNARRAAAESNDAQVQPA